MHAKTWLRLLVLMPLLLLCSCAATFGGGPFLVPVDSVPPNATVSYMGANIGRTPCVVPMKSDSHELLLKLDGYHPQKVWTGRTDNTGWVLLGILMWGPFELIAAAEAKAWSGIQTAPLRVPLVPSDQPAPTRAWHLPGVYWYPKKAGA